MSATICLANMLNIKPSAGLSIVIHLFRHCHGACEKVQDRDVPEWSCTCGAWKVIPLIYREQKHICWWIHRHTTADRTDTTLSKKLPFHPVPTFEIFPQLACFPGVSLITNARLPHEPAFAAPSKTVCFLHSHRVLNRSEEEKRTKSGGSQAWTRLYDFQHDLHNCMHLMQREYTVPARMIRSYLRTAP